MVKRNYEYQHYTDDVVTNRDQHFMLPADYQWVHHGLVTAFCQQLFIIWVL